MSDPRSGVSEETLRSISTPDSVQSRLGALSFDDGAPSEETAALLYDHLDFVHGVEAFINVYPGASRDSLRRAPSALFRRWSTDRMPALPTRSW
jgi:hypothetical protein